MTKKQPSAMNAMNPCHPGEIIGDYLEARGWTQSVLAERSGLTFDAVNEICSCQGSVSPWTAAGLARALGRPPHFWLNAQRNYDMAQAGMISPGERLRTLLQAIRYAQHILRDAANVNAEAASGRAQTHIRVAIGEMEAAGTAIMETLGFDAER